MTTTAYYGGAGSTTTLASASNSVSGTVQVYQQSAGTGQSLVVRCDLIWQYANMRQLQPQPIGVALARQPL